MVLPGDVLADADSDADSDAVLQAVVKAIILAAFEAVVERRHRVEGGFGNSTPRRCQACDWDRPECPCRTGSIFLRSYRAPSGSLSRREQCAAKPGKLLP